MNVAKKPFKSITLEKKIGIIRRMEDGQTRPNVCLKGKVRFMGLFQHCGRSAYCILTPNKFPHSSPEAPRTIQMRETSTSEGGNYYQ